MVLMVYKCIFGPKLIRLYRSANTLGRNYVPNNTEYYSNTIIDIFHGIYLFCKWTSPALLAFAYYKGYLTVDYLISFSKIISYMGTIVFTAYLFRGVGRFVNLDYETFITEYAKLKTQDGKYSTEHRLFLLKYDFVLDNWPAEFKSTKPAPVFKNEPLPAVNGIFGYVKQLGLRLLGKLCVDTFGLRMMYPGVVLQSLFKPILAQGRAKLIESKGAKRSVIHPFDHKNVIDTVFIDKRNTSSQNGQTLIICCDGNAAFYEMGIFGLCADTGYSALGWNYPGFGASTGLPYPDQLTSAADAIMQYAFSLGYKPENIILFSWSIGGFATSWLASNYPDVKGVILDACFDHIVHLAIPQMPAFASDLVDFAIRTRFNLDILKLIKLYPGPVKFVRRTNDEIISTIHSVPATNRGNDLLIGLLKKRYPYILNDETESLIRLWLKESSEAGRVRVYDQFVTRNNYDEIESLIKSYIEEYNLTYPLSLGNEMNNEMKGSIALYLATRYLSNHESTHCIPLPLKYIKEPWTESDILNGTGGGGYRNDDYIPRN